MEWFLIVFLSVLAIWNAITIAFMYGKLEDLRIMMEEILGNIYCRNDVASGFYTDEEFDTDYGFEAKGDICEDGSYHK